MRAGTPLQERADRDEYEGDSGELSELYYFP